MKKLIFSTFDSRLYTVEGLAIYIPCGNVRSGAMPLNIVFPNYSHHPLQEISQSQFKTKQVYTTVGF